MGLQEMGWGGMDWSDPIRTGTSRRLLWTW